MEITGSYLFDAPQEAVWARLMDASTIAACVPGCRELQPVGEDRYQARLAAPVAAITGQFEATIAIEDKEPPQSYRLVVSATGRPGFARGHATIALSPEETQTRVLVTASAETGGAVARVGQRLLESAARMMMDRFFECLRSKCVTR